MRKEVFEFRNYKTYLKYWLQEQPGKGRGLQTAFAEKMGCQTAYVSQVLNSGANFSLEQGEALNSFIGHSEEEGHYFLLLIESARAGTQVLRQRFERQIERIREQRLILKNRVDIKKALDPHDQATYYSIWHYAAIHIAVTVPQLRTRDALKERFGLNDKAFESATNFLLSVGLIEKSGDQYLPGISRLFLGKDSPMIHKHHTNWRLRALSALEQNNSTDLHFSTVVSLSKSDLLDLKEKLVKSIEETRATIRESKEETVACFNLDFFELHG